jgi:hypothetical protein
MLFNDMFDWYLQTLLGQSFSKCAGRLTTTQHLQMHILVFKIFEYHGHKPNQRAKFKSNHILIKRTKYGLRY